MCKSRLLLPCGVLSAMPSTYLYKAILLVGPTGSGKTPLGEMCERKGLWGRSCLHFDFGEQLRRIVKGDAAASFLSLRDMAVIFRSLETGKLLEKEHSHIAGKMLSSFIEEKGAGKDVLLVMNGLPRHLSQAKYVDSLVEMEMVLYLDCSPEVVKQRILLNSGGDRTARVDDSLPEVEMKLKLFRERTFPILDYYRSKGTRVEQIEVGTESTLDTIRHSLNDITL